MTSQVIFTFEIDSANAAVVDAPLEEVSRLLKETARKIESGYEQGSLLDYNGNKVGAWWLSLAPDDDDIEDEDNYEPDEDDLVDDIDEGIPSNDD